MSNSGDVDPGEEKTIPGAGSSTDQNVSASPETGTFITDVPPAGDTPATGSSNAGINATGANRKEGTLAE
jgi:hypothetical protein